MKKILCLLILVASFAAQAALDSVTATSVMFTNVASTVIGSTNTVSTVNNFELTLFTAQGGAASTNNVQIQLQHSADRITWTTNSTMVLTNTSVQTMAVNLNGLYQYWKIVGVATNGTAQGVSVLAIGKPERVNSQ